MKNTISLLRWKPDYTGTSTNRAATSFVSLAPGILKGTQKSKTEMKHENEWMFEGLVRALQNLQNIAYTKEEGVITAL